MSSALCSEISVQRPDDRRPLKNLRLFERKTCHTNNVFLARERERAQGKANRHPQCNHSPNEATSEHLKPPWSPNQPDPQCPITPLTTSPHCTRDIHKRASIFGPNSPISQSEMSKIHFFFEIHWIFLSVSPYSLSALIILRKVSFICPREGQFTNISLVCSTI
jgi:hypothetical protein